MRPMTAVVIALKPARSHVAVDDGNGVSRRFRVAVHHEIRVRIEIAISRMRNGMTQRETRRRLAALSAAGRSVQCRAGPELRSLSSEVMQRVRW